MKFTFALISLAFVGSVFGKWNIFFSTFQIIIFYFIFLAAENDLLNRAETILGKAEDTVKKVNSGSDEDRKKTIKWAFSNLERMRMNVEMGKNASDMPEMAKENLKLDMSKVENEMNVYEGVFKGHESEPTEETVVKAAKEMIEDAKSQNPSEKESRLIESLQERLNDTEKYGYEGKDLFKKMIDLNEATNFYSTPDRPQPSARIYGLH